MTELFVNTDTFTFENESMTDYLDIYDMKKVVFLETDRIRSGWELVPEFGTVCLAHFYYASGKIESVDLTPYVKIDYDFLNKSTERYSIYVNQFYKHVPHFGIYKMVLSCTATYRKLKNEKLNISVKINKLVKTKEI